MRPGIRTLKIALPLGLSLCLGAAGLVYAYSDFGNLWRRLLFMGDGPVVAEELKQAELRLDTASSKKSEPDRHAVEDHGKDGNEQAIGSKDRKPEDGHEKGPAGHGAKAKEAGVEMPDIYLAPLTRSSRIVAGMREISILQTNMASGIEARPKLLKERMLEFAGHFRQPDVTSLASSEVDMVALYVLSGGDPVATARVARLPDLPQDKAQLAMGVTQFAVGDFAKARELLLDLDARTFSATLGAQVSIVQSALLPETGTSKKIELLAFAANRVPGTLIEEAAIRRLLLPAAQHEKFEGLMKWATRYVRRFPDSLYLGDFDSSFLDAFRVAAAGSKSFDQQLFQAFFRSAGNEHSQALSQELMLLALHSGKVELCEAVSGAMRVLASEESQVSTSFQAMALACSASSGEPKLIAKLEGLRTAELSKDASEAVQLALKLSRTVAYDNPGPEHLPVGPQLPLDRRESDATLMASVAQQLEASKLAIGRARK